MQRRDFSRSLMAATALAATSGLALQPARAQRIAFAEGKDYLRLARPVPVSSPAGQVEVLEFFSYTCVHCANFEPLLNDWIKRKPAHVTVRRVPVAFNQAFLPWQRLYFTLEGLGLVDTLHDKVFAAFHQQGLTTPDTMLAWVFKQGVDKDKFNAVYNGAAVKQAAIATGLQNAYEVEGTPALGVAGRFYISGQGPRTLLIADTLVAEARRG